MKVSVVMLSYGKTSKQKEMTQQAIDSIHNSTTNHTFDIIVVETAPDVTYRNVKKVIYPNEKFNYNRFLNIGIKECDKNDEYIILSNNDIIAGRRFFDVALSLCGSLFFDSASFNSPNWNMHDDIRGKIVIGHTVQSVFTGWFLMFRRSSLEKLLPLDEQFDFWYSDDDLSAQMLKKGMVNAFIGIANITHLNHASHSLVDDKKEFNKMTHGAASKFVQKYSKELSFWRTYIKRLSI